MTSLFMDNEATLSECRRFRYSLRRTWDRERPRLGWIMLNPSTADETEDDPTIRRCIGFADRWGFGGIEVCNVFPIRSTDPSILNDFDVRNDHQHENRDAIRSLVVRCHSVMFAWGSNKHATLTASRHVVLCRIHRAWCLDRTKEGHPKHPLYVRGDQWPLIYHEVRE